MATKQWFVKNGNDLLGPVNGRELRQLVKTGLVNQESRISRDQKRWVKATQVKGLLESPSPDTKALKDNASFPQNVLTERTRESFLPPRNKRTIITVGCFLFLTAGVAIWFRVPIKDRAQIINNESTATNEKAGVTHRKATSQNEHSPALNDEAGNAQHHFVLGLRYLEGDGVQQNDEKAAEHFRKAAEQNFAEAQFNLGFMYYRGKGVPKDEKEAAKWYLMSAENHYAKGQLIIGQMYESGVGVQQDLLKANKWLNLAASSNDPQVAHKANDAIGRVTVLGNDLALLRVERNKPQATEILTSDAWTWTKPERFSAPINSGHHDTGGYISADGLSLVFSSNRPGGPSAWNLWMSTRSSESEQFSRPTILANAINQYDAVSPCLAHDGLTLYFAATPPESQTRWRDLWMTTRATLKSDWSEPLNLGNPVNTTASEDSPSISSDGLTLYFMSNRTDSGTVGDDVHIWQATRKSLNSNWEQPIRLDNAVNKTWNTRTPFISTDQKSLVFYRMIGEGGLGTGLWFVSRTSMDAPFQNDQRLLAPNPQWAEGTNPSLTFDGKFLVFTSNHRGSTGWDLWWSKRVSEQREAKKQEEIQQIALPKKSSDKPPPKKELPRIATKSISAHLFKVNSNKYLQHGFQKYRFGLSAEEVKRTTPFKADKDNVWIDTGDIMLYFSEGRLRGIHKKYQGDNSGYTKSLSELLGSCPAEDVYSFSGTNETEVRANYRFPKTLAYVRAYESSEYESVNLTMFDRDWIIDILDRDMRDKLKILQGAKIIIDYCNQDQFDWGSIPTYPNTTSDSTILFPLDHKFKYRGFNGKEGGDWENRISGSSVISVFEDFKDTLVVQVECYSAPEYNPHPLLKYPGTARSTEILHEDMTRCNSFLTQTLFESVGTSIKVISRHDANGFTKAYEWESKNGWTIQVEKNNKLIFWKRSRKKL